MKITTFKNFTPNSTRGTYYLPKKGYTGAVSRTKTYEDQTAMLNAMKKDADITTDYSSQTFKIYEEYIDISRDVSAVAALASELNITYLAIDDSVNKQIIFYYVTSVKPLPQGYRLYIQLDYWATYISVAYINQVHFHKTNVYIDEELPQLYTTEEVPCATKTKRVGVGIGLPITQSMVRYLAIVELEENADTSGTISRTIPFLFNPFDQPYIDTIVGSNKELQILAAIEAIQNIYETANRGKASVKKLFVVPSTHRGATPVFKTVLYGQKVEIKGFNLSSYIKIYEENYNLTNGNVSPAIIDPVRLDIIGGDLYAGTRYNSLKLPSFVGGYSVQILYNLGFDDLKITVTNGEDSRDISESFMIGVNPNLGTLTSQERMAKALGTITNIAGGVFQIAAGGAGLVSGVSGIAQTITGLTEHRNGAYIANGNAIDTFKDIVKNNGSGYIFYILASESIKNNQRTMAIMQVMQYGADCNIYYKEATDNLLNYLPNFRRPLVCDVEAPVYIAASATVDNVPMEASEAISNALNAGIRIRFIES